MKSALLVIDVQNDYFPNGNMELAGSVEAGKSIRKVMDEFRKEKKTIIHIQHIAAKPDATFFLPGTKGAEFHDFVLPEKEEMIIKKNYPNAFRNTELHKLCTAEGITKLVIVGMMTHMCIDATARAAFDLGYQCILLSDCCATKNLNYDGKVIDSSDVQASFLAAIDGTFATVMDSKEYLENQYSN
jgi:nicotinamidase-related amidase